MMAEQGTCPRCTYDAERQVLQVADQRFREFMTERHYLNEEAVLGEILETTTANKLIRAVAAWRIACRGKRS